MTTTSHSTTTESANRQPSSTTTRRRRQGLAALTAAAAATIGLWASPAGAAGPPVERFDGVYATCDHLGEIFAVSLPSDPHAELVPTFVLDTGQVLVTISATYVSTFTPTGGAPQTTTQSVSRRAPARASLDSCHARGGYTTDEGTYELELDATMAVRP